MGFWVENEFWKCSSIFCGILKSWKRNSFRHSFPLHFVWLNVARHIQTGWYFKKIWEKTMPARWNTTLPLCPEKPLAGNETFTAKTANHWKDIQWYRSCFWMLSTTIYWQIQTLLLASQMQMKVKECLCFSCKRRKNLSASEYMWRVGILRQYLHNKPSELTSASGLPSLWLKKLLSSHSYWKIWIKLKACCESDLQETEIAYECLWHSSRHNSGRSIWASFETWHLKVAS